MLRPRGSEIRFFMLDISGNPETTDLSRAALSSGISVTERYHIHLLRIIYQFNLQSSTQLCQKPSYSLRIQSRPRRP